MAEHKPENKNVSDGLRSTSSDAELEKSTKEVTPQVKLAPLTICLCIGILLLSIDRTIVAIGENLSPHSVFEKLLTTSDHG